MKRKNDAAEVSSGPAPSVVPIPADTRLADAAKLLEEAGTEIARLRSLLAPIVDPDAEDAEWQMKTLHLALAPAGDEAAHEAAARLKARVDELERRPNSEDVLTDIHDMLRNHAIIGSAFRNLDAFDRRKLMSSLDDIIAGL